MDRHELQAPLDDANQPTSFMQTRRVGITSSHCCVSNQDATITRAQSRFWAVLHRLVGELEKEGQNDQERAEALLDQMDTMPPEFVNTSLANLEMASACLAELLNRAKTV